MTVAAATPDTVASSPISGRQLVLVRFVWIAVTSAVLALVITAVPIRYEKVRAADPNIRNPEFRNLIEAGVSPDIAATGDLLVGIGFFLALFGSGTLLFWRGSDSRPRWTPKTGN